VKELGLGDAIQFIGSVSNEDMWLAFADAQIHVFPLVEVPGDVEGFGMVAVEAAAAGTPTVAYDLGGVSDAISAQSGRLVAAGDSREFSRAVLEELDTPATSPEGCRQHAMSFSWERYNRQLGDSLDTVRREAGHD
jgi:phosphatidylinositol alpha-1,6-mannosyltransferase